jgi:hypothetical protein
MISIEIRRDSEGKIQEFISRGHGQYEEGRDILCAGTSTLLQTAIIGLEDYLKLDPKIEKEKGFLRCKLERESFLNREIDAILETMVLGLKELENQYPDHIRVWEVESDVKV